MINDLAARKYFGAEPAVGRQVDMNGMREVIGVVQSVRLNGPEQALWPEIYLPLLQTRVTRGDLIVRTTGADVVKPVQDAIGDMATAGPGGDAVSLLGLYRDKTAARRFNMMLMSLFGAVALLVAAVGVYGVMAYGVQRRVREIGVRMALGAAPRQILGEVVTQALRYVGLGAAIGLAAAWAFGRTIASLLFEVGPHDVIVYGSVALVLAAVGLVAAVVPARRAAGVDPLIALRAE